MSSKTRDFEAVTLPVVLAESFRVCLEGKHSFSVTEIYDLANMFEMKEITFMEYRSMFGRRRVVRNKESQQQKKDKWC